MTPNSNFSATIGTVKTIVGDARVTGTDGVVRYLVEGDKVSAGEVIDTSANGAVHIQLATGCALACGPGFSGMLTLALLDIRAGGTDVALDGFVPNPAVAVTVPAEIFAGATVAPATGALIYADISALQAAIAVDASAGGGAPAAGGTTDGGGGTPLLIEQANSQGEVSSGIEASTSEGPAFPDLATQQLDTPSTPTAPPVILVHDGADRGTVQEDVTFVASGQLEAANVDPGATVTWGVVNAVASFHGVLSLDASGDWDYTTLSGMNLVSPFHKIDSVGQSDDASYVVLSLKPDILTDINCFLDLGGYIEIAPTAGSFGAFSVDQNGAWTYTLDNGVDGVNSFVQALSAGQTATVTYVLRATDDEGAFDEQTVTITIAGTNDLPTLTGDTGTVDEDGEQQTQGHIFFQDVDARDACTLTITGMDGEAAVVPWVAWFNANPYSAKDYPSYLPEPDICKDYPPEIHLTTVHGNYGDLMLAPDGHWTYQLDNSKLQFLAEGQQVTETFPVSYSDGKGGVATSEIVITINGANGVPDAVDNTYSVAEDGALIVTGPGILDNDSVGSDGGTLTVVSNTEPGHGALVLNADGSFTYTPTAHYNGPDSFTYTIQDADGDTDTATVAITVTPVNDPPEILLEDRAGWCLVYWESDFDQGEVREDVTLTAFGRLVALEYDFDATRTWSIVGTSESSFGSFSVDGGNWTYTLHNGVDGVPGAVQNLSSGSTITEIYVVRVTDDQGAFDDQNVRITIHGNYDAGDEGPVLILAGAGISANDILVGSEIDTLVNTGSTAVASSPDTFVNLQVEPDGMVLFTQDVLQSTTQFITIDTLETHLQGTLSTSHAAVTLGTSSSGNAAAVTLAGTSSTLLDHQLSLTG